MPTITTGLFGELAFIPTPATVPAVESMEWLTDVIKAEDGTEDRVQVRSSPRRSLRYTIPVNAETYRDVYNTVYGSRTSKWAVPLWAEAQEIGVVLSGAGSISVDTATYDFRDDSIGLLWENNSCWEVVEIQTVAADSLTLYSNIVDNYSNVFLLPVRLGNLSKSPQRITSGYNGKFELEFLLSDNITLSVSEPDTYQSYDIYNDDWLIPQGGLTDNINQNVYVQDSETGIVEYSTPWDNPLQSRTLQKILEGQAEIFAFKEWLYRRAGKYREFWLPSFEADFEVASVGTITDKIDVIRDSYELADNYNHIAVLDSSGNWHTREITSYTLSGLFNYELSLDSALNIEASEIVSISFLTLKRLQSDKVDFNFLSGNVCKVAVGIVEV